MNASNPPDGPGLLNAALNAIARQGSGGVKMEVIYPRAPRPPGIRVCEADAGLTYGRTRRDDD